MDLWITTSPQNVVCAQPLNSWYDMFEIYQDVEGEVIA
jgi:hypothetical protein